MTKTNIKEELFSDCPIRNILARISDKWSMLILFMLYQNGTMRFNSLRHNIPDISQKMLSSTLRTLEEDGYILRKSYAEVPPRVEYSLSERGKSIIPHIEGLIDWAKITLKIFLMTERKILPNKSLSISALTSARAFGKFLLLDFCNVKTGETVLYLIAYSAEF